jgi:hypothetical protein
LRYGVAFVGCDTHTAKIQRVQLGDVILLKRGLSEITAAETSCASNMHEIALVDYSMRRKHVLGVASSSTAEHLDSQTSELEQLAEVADLLEEKAGYSTSDSPDLSVDPLVEAVIRVAHAYPQLLPAGG